MTSMPAWSRSIPRFVETSPSSTACLPQKDPCIGGFARLATVVKQKRRLQPDSLLLNAGDVFQGTIWYNILGWNVTQLFMNFLTHDAHVFGNHEFDSGIDGIVPYLLHLKAPMVAANINATLEPSLNGLFERSVILERNGRKIGLTGVVLTDTPNRSSTGNLIFHDELTSVRDEVQRLTADGVDIIIVVSHAGIETDIKIAKHGGPIDLIVGGHSHVLLYNGPTPNGESTFSEYPLVVQQDVTNNTVLIVQASAYTRYVGEISAYFDERGLVRRWEGQPTFLANDIGPDHDVVSMLEPFSRIVDIEGRKPIGYSRVILDKTNCLFGGCSLGSFACDAFVDWMVDKAPKNQWTSAAICIIPRGAIRSSIEVGNITLEDLVISSPYDNSLHSFDIKGVHLLASIEHSLKTFDQKTRSIQRMLQVSGLHGIYNLSRAPGHRVQSLLVRCAECVEPYYEPLRLDKYYKVVTQSHLSEGGGGFSMLKNNRRNIEEGPSVLEILARYIKKISPIDKQPDRRITMIY